MKTAFFLYGILSLFLLSCAQLEKTSERNPDSVTATDLLQKQVTYDSCSDPNSRYLEKKLSMMPPEYLRADDRESQNRLPIQCIQLAQRSHVGNYAVCDAENSKPKISQIRPCMSEPYVNLVSNAYNDVMDCFNMDPKEMFYQIMIESGFHINAINKSGFDSGLAQFTKLGLEHVKPTIDRAQRVLLESSRPSCQRISSIVGHFDVDASSVDKRCSMIVLPKNPYRSMLFAYLHTKIDQIILDELLQKTPEIYEALTDKVKRQFLYLSYNRGMQGFLQLLRGYIDSRNYFGHKITEQDLDLYQNLSKAKIIMAREPEKRAELLRRPIRNLSFAEYAIIRNVTYLSEMSAARDYVERYYGNSCGEF